MTPFNQTVYRIYSWNPFGGVTLAGLLYSVTLAGSTNYFLAVHSDATIYIGEASTGKIFGIGGRYGSTLTTLITQLDAGTTMRAMALDPTGQTLYQINASSTNAYFYSHTNWDTSVVTTQLNSNTGASSTFFGATGANTGAFTKLAISGNGDIYIATSTFTDCYISTWRGPFPNDSGTYSSAGAFPGIAGITLDADELPIVVTATPNIVKVVNGSKVSLGSMGAATSGFSIAINRNTRAIFGVNTGESKVYAIIPTY